MLESGNLRCSEPFWLLRLLWLVFSFLGTFSFVFRCFSFTVFVCYDIFVFIFIFWKGLFDFPILILLVFNCLFPLFETTVLINILILNCRIPSINKLFSYHSSHILLVTCRTHIHKSELKCQF